MFNILSFLLTEENSYLSFPKPSTSTNLQKSGSIYVPVKQETVDIKHLDLVDFNPSRNFKEYNSVERKDYILKIQCEIKHNLVSYY